jgi:hypothetical protein
MTVKEIRTLSEGKTPLGTIKSRKQQQQKIIREYVLRVK